MSVEYGISCDDILAFMLLGIGTESLFGGDSFSVVSLKLMTRMWPLWFAMGRVAQAIEVGAVAHGSYMYLLLRSTCYVHDVYSLCTRCVGARSYGVCLLLYLLILSSVLIPSCCCVHRAQHPTNKLNEGSRRTETGRQSR